jgi:hypothetical protein
MADIDQVITVNISRETSAVSQVGFGTGMFLGDHRRFIERYKSYKSAAEVLADGFASTDAEYIVATKFFGQELKPTKLAIGRRKAVDIATLTFSAAVSGTSYSVTVNGVVLSYTAAGIMTAIAVAAAFETANAAGFVTAGITFSDAAADGTATITPTVAATPISIVGETSTIVIVNTYTETLTDALAAVADENSDFFVVMAKSHIKADQLELATVVESMDRIYVTSSSDVNIKNQSAVVDTTSIARALKDGSYNNTALMYSAVANSQYPEAAFVGYNLSYQPGENTWKFKTLSGITVDSLTTTQINNIKAKYCNYYTNIRNINITSEGVTSSSEFLDVTVGVMWFKARLAERLFNLLINAPKIPYTAAGLAAVQAEVLGQRQEGIASGFLSGSKSDLTIVPNMKDVSFADKATRTLNNVKFEYKLAGAVHFINVAGSVVL